jgi:hypothetical protein
VRVPAGARWHAHLHGLTTSFSKQSGLLAAISTRDENGIPNN